MYVSMSINVEGTVALLATFYVFMYEYPPGFVIFFVSTKCILQIEDGRKLP